MAIYAVGDIQGCYDPLRRLLDQVAFDPSVDELWCVGDLVNRGPQSRQVLQFLRALGQRCKAVLGNHDLHLLAVSFGARKQRGKDTFNDVLSAPDREELCAWLRQLPLAHYAEGTLMVHAGVVPSWDLETTLSCALEVARAVQSPDAPEFFSYMYGNTPHSYSADLVGLERLRVITNVLTRVRFCSADDQLDLECVEAPEFAPAGMLPWYAHKNRRTQNVPIVFGHWATLNGNVSLPDVFALDTGCAWGNTLTAMRLSDKQRFSCGCAG
ncbi:MAG TPA: symmetrical bis(5'-nucleosyl)-tetraphosphatase [Polyangiaceae bacterium]|jgi:bis(5'-nucleosyl)-tetraphosphatase (symmetrical)|nr:symmetrical bis(5'-nucleosyl)-tetraphosphatase [Polyangiaceae bacterium]